jgi:hypothetical protein
MTRQPDRYDYATHDDYLLAWNTWRAIERDSHLTHAEWRMQLGVLAERLGLTDVLADFIEFPSPPGTPRPAAFDPPGGVGQYANQPTTPTHHHTNPAPPSPGHPDP